jgi:hypothetical protein
MMILFCIIHYYEYLFVASDFGAKLHQTDVENFQAAGKRSVSRQAF